MVVGVSVAFGGADVVSTGFTAPLPLPILLPGLCLTPPPIQPTLITLPLYFPHLLPSRPTEAATKPTSPQVSSTPTSLETGAVGLAERFSHPPQAPETRPYSTQPFSTIPCPTGPLLAVPPGPTEAGRTSLKARLSSPRLIAAPSTLTELALSAARWR